MGSHNGNRTIGCELLAGAQLPQDVSDVNGSRRFRFVFGCIRTGHSIVKIDASDVSGIVGFGRDMLGQVKI